MPNRATTLLFIMVVGLSGLLIVSCGPKEEAIQTTTTPYILEKQPGEVYYKGLRVDKAVKVYYSSILDEPVILTDNSEAKNPSYQNLTSFLEQTRTARDAMCRDVDWDFYAGKPYYTCGYYVEEMHNDAEAMGIRAGIAILEATTGVCHGINAFETTDVGLVYVDGSYYSDRVFNLITVGQIYEVFGTQLVIKEITLIWDGYKL